MKWADMWHEWETEEFYNGSCRGTRVEDTTSNTQEKMGE